MYPPIETEIWQTETYRDNDGIEWYVINQDTSYNLSSSEWTMQSAIEDYQDPERARKRVESEWSSWVD